MEIYLRIQKEIQSYGATLVAVSKTKPVELIREVYDQGHLDFGENRAQDLRDKHELLPPDIHWHMIGHLQKNKVKYLAPFIHLIHSVDDLALLQTIEKQAERFGRKINVLLQIKIAAEESKFGLSKEQCDQLVSSAEFKALKQVQIRGLMGMATFTENTTQIRREFKSLKTYFDELKRGPFNGSEHFKEISMGMSADYKIALDEGATIVRIGSLIFGPRT